MTLGKCDSASSKIDTSPDIISNGVRTDSASFCSSLISLILQFNEAHTTSSNIAVTEARFALTATVHNSISSVTSAFEIRLPLLLYSRCLPRL